MATRIGICWSLLAANFRGQMQYRANFLILITMGLVYQGTGFVFIWILLSRFQAIAGWTLGDIAFLYGLRLIVHALQGILFGSFAELDVKVRQGDFDRFLVRPLEPLLQVITQPGQTVNLLGDFLGGVVLFGAANALVRVDWSIAAVAYLGLAIVGGALVEGATMLALASLSFRFLSIGNLIYLVNGIGFNNFGNYPMTVYGSVLRFFLTFGLPIAFVAYLPATVLLGRTGELSIAPAFAYLAPLAGVLWFAFAYRVWQHEIRLYQSAGN